jgi:hypothetical protein
MLDTLKTKRFADDEIVIAWQSFAVDGVFETIAKGTRLRGNHPAVRKAPGYFVPDGLPESEWPSVYDAAGAAIERTDSRERAERVRQGREPAVIPPEKQVVCTIGFVSAKGRTYVEGAIYHRDDPAVKDKATRKYFAKPAQPLVAE